MLHIHSNGHLVAKKTVKRVGVFQKHFPLAQSCNSIIIIAFNLWLSISFKRDRVSYPDKYPCEDKVPDVYQHGVDLLTNQCPHSPRKKSTKHRKHSDFYDVSRSFSKIILCNNVAG